VNDGIEKPILGLRAAAAIANGTPTPRQPKAPASM
jgi:hypothetical protein